MSGDWMLAAAREIKLGVDESGVGVAEVRAIIAKHCPDGLGVRDEAGRIWLSVAKAAKASGVSRRTLYYWLSAGRLETRVSVSGKRLIARDSLSPRAPRGGVDAREAQV